MKRLLLTAAAAVALAGCGVTEPNAGRYPPPAPSTAEAGGIEAARTAVTSAIADPARPAADRERDARSRPSEILAFARVAPGQRVADLWPGGGYYTRLLARAVGPQGRVYAFVPNELPARYGDAILPVANDTAGCPNVTLQRTPQAAFASENLDLVFTNQNYHDFHNVPGDVTAFNRAVFAALRPGGLYVIVDHSGRDGTGFTEANTLHRAEQAAVRREVEAAGFVFDGESGVLRNPADPRTASVFDEAIRGRTDQFVMRFRKPLPR